LQPLPEGPGLRSAELVDAAARDLPFDRARYRLRHVADIDRLEAGVAAADQRQSRRQAREPCEAVEEIVLRTEHDRRTQDHRIGYRLQHRLLAARLGVGVWHLRLRVRSDRRYVDEARALRPRRLGHGARAEILDRIEGLAAALVEDA